MFHVFFLQLIGHDFSVFRRDLSSSILRIISFANSFVKMIQSCVFIAIFAISCHWVEKSLAQDKKAALVIDRLTGSVIDLPPGISKESQCGSWANACPAQSPADEAFVAENALSTNPLFIQQICTEGKTLEMAKFEKDICTKYFQISAVFNKMNTMFDFGYEVYFLEENEDSFLHPSPRRNYVDVKKFMNMKRDLSSKIMKNTIQDIPTNENSTTEEITDKIEDSHFDQKNTYLHDGRNKRFMRISVFQVEFDFKQLTPERVFYEVRNNNKWPISFGTSCEKDKLTNEVYDELDVYSKYSDGFQKEIFASYALPRHAFFAECVRNICVSQWSLIPEDQFHFDALKEKICSHVATIPIWTGTLGLSLIKVDKFIYALFQAMGSPLHIIAGIKGQLKLKTRFLGENELESNIYMDMTNKKIPVPEIIYKVVKYKSDDCSEGDSCWYSATIIIHNNPFFHRRNKICPDVTIEWGWEELTLVDTPGSMESLYRTKYIYVCKSEPELLKQLMGDSAEGQPKNMKDFNLNKLSLNGQNMPVRDVVNKNILNLTEIQSELMERFAITSKYLLGRKGGHLDSIEEENIIGNGIGNIPLAVIYRYIQIKQSKYKDEQPLSEESKNFDTATTSNISDSNASLNGKSDQEKQR